MGLESAFAVSTTQKITKQTDPSHHLLGLPSNLCNWLPNSGATKHITPHLTNLKDLEEDLEEDLDLGIKVADGHIHCTQIYPNYLC